MGKILKRNLFLISKKFSLYFLSLLIILVKLIFEKDAFGFFIFFISASTCISALSIYEFDRDNYKTTFSLPVIRDEFAKTKALTLLLMFVAYTVLSLAMYVFTVLLGITETIDFPLLILGLSLAFILSMIFGGIGLTVGDKLPLIYAFLYLVIFDYMDIPSIIYGNTILIYLVSAILLTIGRTAYVITKENIIRICSEMEL